MMPLKEMAASNAQSKGRAEKYQVASQEQWQLPVEHVHPSSPSVGRGEEEGGQSAPVKELVLQPLSSSLMPDGG